MVPIPQAPLWKFLVVTGLRYGEAATLRWADLDENAGVVTVRAEVAKSKRTRLVPVPGYDLLRKTGPAIVRGIGGWDGQKERPDHAEERVHGEPDRRDREAG